MEKRNIILLGNENLIQAHKTLMTNESYEIKSTESISNALTLFAENKAIGMIIDAAIFDKINYLDFYYKLAPVIKTNQTIIITEQDSDIWMKKLYTLGFSSFIRKPIHSIELLGVLRNISTINLLSNSLSCNTDHLTKLPNRTQFTLDIHYAIEKAKTNNKIVAVLSIYFEQFKSINDQTGNQGGDVIIKEIANSLKSCISAQDIAARTGGVEFSVLLSNINNKQEIIQTVEKIQHTLLNPFYYNTHEFQLKFTMGVSVFPHDGNSAELLYANAENARIYSQDNGQHRFQFYNNDIYIESFKQLKMENNLRDAIDRDEFILHYQPQINLASGHVIGSEAFIRWQHPEKELLASREFITLAEQTGLIIPIGEWVAYAACTQGKAWHDGGYIHPISINISDSQFNRKNCLELIEKALAFTKLQPKLLEIELTENMILADIHNATKLCAELKEMGVSLAIDDFGTGFSSINYLRKLSIDKIKIDKSFIHRIGVDAEDEDIIKAMISMAHGLKLKVIAEGVETQGQKDFLTTNKCDIAQGYFFCQPLPPKSLLHFLETEKSWQL